MWYILGFLVVFFLLFAFVGLFSFPFYILGFLFSIFSFPITFFEYIYPVGFFPKFILLGVFFFCFARLLLSLIPGSPIGKK